MFGFIKSSEKINPTSQDYSKEKSLSIDNNGETFGISIFGEGLVIDEAFSDILGEYDLDGDKKLNTQEALTLQKALLTAAGEDGILDQKEINRLLTKSEKTTELSERNTALFKALVISLKNGPQNFKAESGYDNDRALSSIKEDGSGVRVHFFQTENGDAYRIEFLSKEGKLRGLVTSTNCDFREGKNYEQTDENMTTHIIYNDEGKVAEQSCIYKGDNRINPYTEFSSFEYDNNGNLVKKYDLYNNLRTKDKSNIITLYDEGGNITQKTISSVINGLNQKEVIKYDKDGATILSQYVQREKSDIIRVEEYSGANISNRLGHLPTKLSVYDKMTGLLKTEVTNKFNEEGILIGRTVFDKANNTLKEYDYSSVNGIIEHSSQGGIGDCFFLTTLNTLNTNKKGQDVLNNTITTHTITDENGNKQKIYTVRFNGAEKIIEDLNKGIRNFPKEKIFIQSEYTITEEELQEAAIKAGKDYSSGDKDILLQEIAYSKYRHDAAETMQANNESNSILDSSNNLIAGFDVARGWGVTAESIADGGMLGLTMYLYTGKKSEAYFSKSENHPVCQIDSNGNLSATENSSSIWRPNIIKQESNAFDKRYDDINKVVKILKKDTDKDGTFKNYVAEVSLSITNQVVNGQVIENGNHAFTIKGIKDDKVILINPWDSTKEVQISLEDFIKSAQMINMLKL